MAQDFFQRGIELFDFAWETVSQLLAVAGRQAREGCAEPPSGAVRSQLQRILDSNLFLCSQRLSACLRYVVELTLDGEGSSLKEQVLGSELYGKGPEFDGSADSIVRVDARRLRD